MNFTWAINQLEQEKKVRRPSWEDNSYWMIGSAGIILWTDGTTAKIHLNQIKANDWEIFKEKKESLSDKIYGDGHCSTEDVKDCFQNIQADIKKVKGWKDGRVDPKYVLKIIKRRFGERLTNG